MDSLKKNKDKAKEKAAQEKQDKAEYLKLKQSGVADEDNPYYVKPKEEKSVKETIKGAASAVKEKTAEAWHTVGDQVKGRTGEDKKGK